MGKIYNLLVLSSLAGAAWMYVQNQGMNDQISEVHKQIETISGKAQEVQAMICEIAQENITKEKVESLKQAITKEEAQLTELVNLISSQQRKVESIKSQKIAHIKRLQQEITSLIEQNRERLNAKDSDGVTVFMHFLGTMFPVFKERNEALYIIKELIRNGASLQEVDNNGLSPLVWVIKNNCGAESIYELLIENGADIHRTSKTGRTALSSACQRGLTAAVKPLLSHHANINATSINGVTCLMFAVVSGNTDVCHLLIQAGCNVNSVDSKGLTALMVAIVKGYDEICQVLLQAGADANARDEDGVTPLMIAAFMGRTETCKILLQAGADVYIRDEDGRMAIDCATNEEIKELLTIYKDRQKKLN